MHKGEIINSARLTFRPASRWQKREDLAGARGQKYHTAETPYEGLSFSTYRSLALAFFDERERVKERDVGKRAKSTQPSSHSLCQKTEGKPSLPTGKIWHAVCNRSDLFLSMPLKEKKRLRMMGPMCQFSRLQLIKTNRGVDFRDVKLILRSLKKKKWPRAWK